MFYFVQQLGVVLGVGAQTVILISYLIATRDNTVDQKEEQFGRVVVQVLKFGLYFIVISGVLITVMHFTANQAEIVYTPAFVFKWVLIFVIGTITFMVGRNPYMHFFWEGVLGSHWYALFILHVVAPLTTWPDLLVLYVLWTVGFLLAWNALVYTMRAPKAVTIKEVEKKAPPPAPKPIPPPKPVPPPVVAAAPPPKPAPPPLPQKPAALQSPQLPVVIKPTVAVSTSPVISIPQKPPQKPAPPVPEKPIEDPDANPGLPTIRVMPQTQQDVDRQMRPSVVQFDQQ